MALNFLLKRSGTASKRPDPGSMALGELDINYNSSSGGLFYKDSAGSVVKVGPAEVGSSAPNSSPVGSAGNSVGEFWYDTANSVLKIWNGSSWVETVSTSGFLSTSGGSMTGNLYISNCELQVDSSGTFTSIGTASFSGTTELNGTTSFFFTPTWLENIGPASQVTYDNTTSGLTAIEVQGAVDELNTNVGTAQATADAAVPGATFTALGDLIAGTGSGTYGNLVAGANGTVLSANSACPTGLEWIAAGGGSGTVTDITAGTGLTGGTITTSGTIALDSACVIAPSLLTTTGDTLYASAANTPARLAIGTAGQVLTVSGGVPAWVSPIIGATDSVTPFSTKLGYNAGLALNANTLRNTAVGYASLDLEATGDDLVALGYNALTSVNNGMSWSVAIGSSAGENIAHAAHNSVFVGWRAAQNATAGISNVAIGSSAGRALAGSNNVVVGQGAGSTGAPVTNNVFVGNNAGAASTGSGNVFVGAGAGDVTTTSNNVAIGLNALGGSASSTGSVAVGFESMLAATTGIRNTAVGFQTLRTLNTGQENTVVGYNAGTSITSGSANVALGNDAMDVLTTGCFNTAIGSNALGTATTSCSNTAVGWGTLNLATGASNTAVGKGAGANVSTGAFNVLIGDGAGDAITTGANNTILGDITGSAALTGNLILGAGTTVKLQVNENGAVGVGPTPSYGTAGQTLQSAGTAAPPTWVSGASGTFTSQDGKTITVTNGLITSIV